MEFGKMKSKNKYFLLLAGAGFAVLAGVITVIDQRQLRPLGETLSAPEQIFKIDGNVPFGITDIKWVNDHGVSLLTGKLLDGRKEDDTTSLPGRVLDLQVPSRAEHLREQQKRMAAASASTMIVAGHQELAAQTLLNFLSRQETRQFIARMEDGGKINILATIQAPIESDSDPHLMTAPGGKWLAFDSDEREENNARIGPNEIAFVSLDGGSTWKFDPKTKVSRWTEFQGRLSNNNAFTLDKGATERSDKEKIWVTRDHGQSWQSMDLRKAVWSDRQERENEVLDASWTVLPGPAGNALGWSSLTSIVIDDEGNEKSQKFLESRRFELDFSGKQVVVRNVSAAPDWGKRSLSNFEIVSNASGEALLSYNGGLYALDPTTRQWAKITIPEIHGVSSNVYHDGVWLGNGIWIIKASGQTIWNVVACYMPPYFGNTRNCGMSSAQAYFYSRDQGKNWIPFVLPISSGEESYSTEILGWDDQRRGMVVARKDSDRLSDNVAIYRLP